MKIKDVVCINELSINNNFPYNEIEYIDTSSVTEGKIEKIQYLKLNEAPSRAKRVVRKNDILISTVRPNLKHFAIFKKPNKNTIASTGYAVITCKKVFPDYLYYYLTTDWYTNYLSCIAESQQSNYPAFNPSLIENMDIKIPPLPIQKKIAAVLTAYDDLIENNNRRIAILEKMAEEIYREWFVRMRFPGHEKVKIKKGLPEGWEVVELNKIASETSIATKPGIHLENRFYLPLDLLCSKKIIPSNHLPYTEAQSSLVLFEKGDILFGAMRPYLHKVSIAPFNGVTRTTCFVIRPKQNIYYSYLYLLLFQKNSVDYANLICNGCDRPYVIWNNGFEKMQIIKPDSSTISKFNTKIKPILDFICNQYFILNNLTQSRNLLLSRLISGKLSVEDLDIKFPPSMEDADA